MTRPRKPLRRVLGKTSPSARVRDLVLVDLDCGHRELAREGQKRKGCRVCPLLVPR